MKNFELTNETVVNETGVTLHRIRAVKDIVTPHFTVKAGDLGGFVEKEENLDDNALVSDDAMVYDNARVYDNAWVSETAVVY